MNHDLLVEKAILLRDILSKLEYCLEEQTTLTVADNYFMQQMDHACKACIALGYQWITTHDSLASKNEFAVFQKLVETNVIDRTLSKRLLSFMAFRKLFCEASLVKGKNIHLKLTSRHLQDFHTFTQNILLA